MPGVSFKENSFTPSLHPWFIFFPLSKQNWNFQNIFIFLFRGEAKKTELVQHLTTDRWTFLKNSFIIKAESWILAERQQNLFKNLRFNKSVLNPESFKKKKSSIPVIRHESCLREKSAITDNIPELSAKNMNCLTNAGSCERVVRTLPLPTVLKEENTLLYYSIILYFTGWWHAVSSNKNKTCCVHMFLIV